MGNTQQLYGRLDMVMLDRQDKIYGSLGMHDSYLLNTVTGNPLTLTHSREGKMDGEATDCKIYGWSKQEATVGRQLFELTDNYLWGYFTNNNTKITTFATNAVIWIPCEPNTTYAISGVSNTSGSFPVATTTELPKIGVALKNITYGKSGTLAYATAEDAKYLCLFVLNDKDSATVDTREEKLKSVVKNLMINKGTVALPYEPYTGGQPSPSPDYPQEIISAGASGKVEGYVYGKNLFDERLVDFSNTTKNIDVPVRLRPGEKYALSADGTRKGAVISLRGFLNEGDGEGDEIITLRCTEGNVGTRIGSGKAVGDYHHYSVRVYYLSQGLKKIQLELGEYNTAYEPYRELQSFPIKSPTGFLGIPVDFGGNYTDANGQQWIADYVDLKRGKYVQNVRTITIDEKTRLWYQKELTTPTVEEGYYTVTCRADGIIGKELLVDKFRCSKAHWTNEIRYCQKEVYAFARSNDNAIVFVLPEERFANKTEFSEYLAEHPLTVMTYLDTPIERNLTQEEIQAYKNLVTYAGTTMVGNDAGCHMECTYKASGNE